MRTLRSGREAEQQILGVELLLECGAKLGGCEHDDARAGNDRAVKQTLERAHDVSDRERARVHHVARRAPAAQQQRLHVVCSSTWNHMFWREQS